MNIRHLAITTLTVLAVPLMVSAQEATGQSPAQGQLQAQAQIPPDARHLIDKKATNAQGKDMGKIKDVLVSPDGKVEAVVLDYKRKNHAVTWDRLKMQGDQVTVDMTEQQLSQLPEYKAARD